MDARDPHDTEALLSQTAWLRALAASLVHDEHAAEDVSQDTWVAALERPPGAGSSVRAYLATIARNLVRDRRKVGANRAARERDAARAEALPATDGLVERFALHRRVVEVVDGLEEPYRTVVLLRWFEELPPRAIAAGLGVSVKTVDTRLARALAQLRARLDREFGGERRTWVLALVRGFELRGDERPAPPLSVAASRVKLVGALALALLVATWAWLRAGAGDAGRPEALLEVAREPQAISAESSVNPREPAPPTKMERASAATAPRDLGANVLVVRVLGPEEAPRAGVRVTIGHSPLASVGLPESKVPAEELTFVQSAETNAQGRVAFEVPPWRSFAAEIQPANCVALRADDLLAGEERVVHVAPPGMLKGRVTRMEDGAPVEGALVAYELRKFGERFAVRTSATGEYELAGLIETPSSIDVVPPHAKRIWHAALVEPGATRVQDFVVERGRMLSGVVRDARTGAPIAGAEVLLAQSSSFDPAYTDARGEYVRFMDGGMAPILRFRAHGYGEHVVWGRNDVEDGRTDVELSPGRSIRGRVVDRGGTPVEGAFVLAHATFSAAIEERRTRSRADGQFEIADLQPKNRQSLVVHLEERGTAIVTLDEEQLQQLDVDVGSIVLAPAATVTGTLRDADGAPIAKATVNASLLDRVRADPRSSTRIRF